jgi:hypothetical protein
MSSEFHNLKNYNQLVPKKGSGRKKRILVLMVVVVLLIAFSIGIKIIR